MYGICVILIKGKGHGKIKFRLQCVLYSISSGTPLLVENLNSLSEVIIGKMLLENPMKVLILRGNPLIVSLALLKRTVLVTKVIKGRVRLGIFWNKNIFWNIFRLFCSWKQNSRNGNLSIPE